MFDKILVANRGEIALRIIRAARELDLKTVCVYSEADRNGSWLSLADETVCIGPPPATDSYLRIDRIVAAAETTGAGAIHPGYGFLAENAQFAEVCRDGGIVFCGPSPEAMSQLGDKIACKKLAKETGTPVFPGTEGAIEEIEEALKVAKDIGYPVIVKAAAGGGGRGMRIVRSAGELEEAVISAKLEAEASFGNGAVYIEKFLERARHIEVQVIGDSHGKAIHLFNRDCTSQRRHQKLIEEGPAPKVDTKKSIDLCESAASLVRAANYSGAATCEFLMDEDQKFYMLEVNTRVQVEHPVTEMITGVDIVKESIRVAAGEYLSWKQDDIQLRGHAIECRINAEDPERNFMPQAGTVESFFPPGGCGVRVDTHLRSGSTIPPNYDSMVAKLIVHGRDRNEAIARAVKALEEFEIGPGKTTIPLQKNLLVAPPFKNVDMDIHWVERFLES